MSGVGQVAASVQTAQGVAEPALSEAVPVYGNLEERIHYYVSHTKAGVSRAVGETTQQMEKEVQAIAPGVVAMHTQQMQALVGNIRGELQAQMEAGHQEAQRQQEMI